MKKILITGKNSYIGKSLKSWLERDQFEFCVDTIDLKDESWRAKDFSKYYAIVHAAGIAHIKETSENKDLYFKVNRDLAFDVAKKAMEEGVNHFVFFSTMSVYGIEKGIIYYNTKPKPNSSYGQSKYEAEQLISDLENDNFIISIIRPPMVYGKGCKGNYPRLARFALKSPLFPKVNNKRSMIYIDNLSEFIKQILIKKLSGIFFPQNSEYVNTSEMISSISKVHGKRVLLTSAFNPIIMILKKLNIGVFNKIFGDLIYEKQMSSSILNYSIFDFEESIIRTEK